MANLSSQASTILGSTHWGSFRASVRDNKIQSLKPFEGDTNPSRILESIAPAIDHRLRVEAPAIREGYLNPKTRHDASLRGRDRFVEVSWDRATAIVAEELQRTIEEKGNKSIFAGSYGWSSAGRFHHAQSQLHRFCNSFGGYTGYKNTYSFAAGEVIVPHVVGGDSYDVIRNLTTWKNIAGNTRLIVAFGGLSIKNSQVHAGGIGDHAVKGWLEECARNGVEVVNIGPIREDMPDFMKSEWLAPRPNSDTALMLGLAHTLLVEGLHDQAFLDRYTTGFDKFRRYLLGEDDGVAKDADFAAAISGLDADAIRKLARRMAVAPTMVTMSFSLQRADHGEQTCWMIITLASMLGGIGLPGSGFGIAYGAVGGYGSPRSPFPSPTLSQGHNPTESFIPVARISDLLLRPGEPFNYDGKSYTYPEIDVVYWAGGNPFHHHQDLNRLVEAWRKPRVTIVNEIHWNSLARHADIVFPATMTLERNDIGASSWDRYVFAMRQVVRPNKSARNDYDIFGDIAEQMGDRNAFTGGKSEMDWLRIMYDDAASRANIEVPSFDEFWERGLIELPEPKEGGILFEAFRRDPDKRPLATPSGRIEIFSPTIASFDYDDCRGHPAWYEPYEWLGSNKAKRHPLHLISSQPEGKLHSQLDFGPASLAGKVKGREKIWINAGDAAARKISTGDIVRVFNDRGACLAAAFVTDGIRPSVVRLPTGAWYDPLTPGEIGTLDRNSNPNVLTRDKGTSQLAQGPSAHSTLVDVELFTGDLPELSVFTPPVQSEASEA